MVSVSSANMPLAKLRQGMRKYKDLGAFVSTRSVLGWQLACGVIYKP